MLSKIKTFFAREDTNTGRQLNVDYAKAQAIVFMILIHIMMYPAASDLATRFGRAFVLVFCVILNAPMFMTSMGFGLAFTKNETPEAMIRRGGWLLLSAYVLNFVRGFVGLLEAVISGQDVLVRVLFFLFNGDILVFAGLGLMLFGLLKKLCKHGALSIFAIGLILLIVASFCRVFNNDSLLLAYTLGLLVPVDYYGDQFVFFQLFPWFFFVAAGYLLGVAVRKAGNPDRLYTVCGAAGAVVAVVLIVLDRCCGWGQLFAEYQAGAVFVLLSFGACLAELALLHFLCKRTPEWLNRLITRFSAAVNEIYMISWILILDFSYPLISALVDGQAPRWWYALSFLLIFPLSTGLGLLWKKRKRARSGIRSR